MDKIKEQAKHAEGVKDVSEVRVRVGPSASCRVEPGSVSRSCVEEGHEIATKARHELLHNLRFLSNATIHVDPANASGEKHHHIEEHKHWDEPSHSH